MANTERMQDLIDIKTEMIASISRTNAQIAMVDKLLMMSNNSEKSKQPPKTTTESTAINLGIDLTQMSSIMNQIREVATGDEDALKVTFGEDTSPKCLELFIEHYNSIKDINKARMVPLWDDPEYRAKIIKCNLRGDALLYIGDACDQDWVRNDEKLLEKLIKHYSNIDILEFSIILCEEAKQEENESLSQYLERLNDLAWDAYGDVDVELRNMLIVVRFIQGLWDANLKSEMLESRWILHAGVAVPCEEILTKAQRFMLSYIGEKTKINHSEVKNTEPNGEWEEVNIDSPSFFHKFLCGRGGVVKKRLEQETGTMITIPRPAENKDYITVKSKSGSAISSLETRVESIVFNARKRQKPTHFLCVPVISDEITQNMSMLLELCQDQEDITPDMIQKTQKLHFTVGVLRLFSQKEIDQARTTLAKFAPQIPYILHGKPLKGELKGLDIMNDDPSSVKVLYSEVLLHDESDRFQMLVDALQKFFVENGLMTYEHNRDSVKLHCTLINSKWRKDKDGPVVPFDATQLMQYSEIDFGEVTLGSLDFNELKIDPETGCYINCCKINLENR